MTEEARLKYSLAVAVVIFLLLNTALVTLAAQASFHGRPFALVPEDTPMGLKWLILAVVSLGAVGAVSLIHRISLESGISPVDTTSVDFIFVAYILLTVLTALFMADFPWFLFGLFVALLFLFTVFILKRLLEEASRWLLWLVGTVALLGLTVVVFSTLFTD